MFIQQYRTLRQQLHNLKQRLQRRIRADRLTRAMCRQSQPMSITPANAVIVAPHADDETLGCGGLIALKRQQGARVAVVILTDGAASHPDHPQLSRAQLVEMRQQEARQALGVLGVPPEQVHFLNQPDQGVATLSEPAMQSVLTQLVQILQDLAPQESYVTYRRDVHPDHEATYWLVADAIAQSQLPVRLYEYPIYTLWRPWLLNLEAEEIRTLHRLPIRPVLSQKKQAIRVYRSQYLPIPPDKKATLPDGFIYRFMQPYELFFESTKLPERN
ncbi:MAG TPA: PIG-L family deacetylase [Leptolyngbyaceae cyanobacterium]